METNISIIFSRKNNVDNKSVPLKNILFLLFFILCLLSI